jgi:hypothetical protein
VKPAAQAAEVEKLKEKKKSRGPVFPGTNPAEMEKSSPVGWTQQGHKSCLDNLVLCMDSLADSPPLSKALCCQLEADATQLWDPLAKASRTCNKSCVRNATSKSEYVVRRVTL